MSGTENDIRDYLQRAKSKDRIVHNLGSLNGARTTREIADYVGKSPSTVRNHLHRMWETGEVQAFDGGASGLSGNAIYWQLVYDRSPADPGSAPPVLPS